MSGSTCVGCASCGCEGFGLDGFEEGADIARFVAEAEFVRIREVWWCGGKDEGTAKCSVAVGFDEGLCSGPYECDRYDWFVGIATGGRDGWLP